jgi:hypothetical protein
LADADSRHTCASARSTGTIDPGTGQLAITTDLTITVAAPAATLGTAPPTDSPRAGSRPAAPGTILAFVALLTISMLALTVSIGRRRSSGP